MQKEKSPLHSWVITKQKEYLTFWICTKIAANTEFVQLPQSLLSCLILFFHMWLHSGGSPNSNCNLETLLHVLTEAWSFFLPQDERSGSRPYGRLLLIFEDSQALWLHPGSLPFLFIFTLLFSEINLCFHSWYGTWKLSKILHCKGFGILYIIYIRCGDIDSHIVFYLLIVQVTDVFLKGHSNFSVRIIGVGGNIFLGDIQNRDFL